MRATKGFLWAIAAVAFLGVTAGQVHAAREDHVKNVCGIVTSDTILSGMIVSLLPAPRYTVEAILPPGQCPGHYDMKLSDIEKVKKADLIVFFQGMPFLERAGLGGKVLLSVDKDGRNWMAPDAYIYGLGLLAAELAKRFPQEKADIMKRKEETIRKVQSGVNALMKKVKRAGIFGKPVIASAMQREPLEWMGFRVVGEYGRPEAMSSRDIVHLAKIGRAEHAIAVVDNLQSGPDTGKGLAETLGAAHVVLTNFPSGKGYLATIEENVDAVVAALIQK